MVKQITPGRWANFRRYGVRPTKSILSTIADIASDWFFYRSVSRLQDDVFDKFELPLMVFAIVSSVMGVLVLISLWRDFRCRCQCPENMNKNLYWYRDVQWVLGLEIMLEDIPQFVLTAWISSERGLISPYAVFNLSTSSFNFVLNLLDMIAISEESTSTDDAQETAEEDKSPAYAVSGA